MTVRQSSIEMRFPWKLLKCNSASLSCATLQRLLPSSQPCWIPADRQTSDGFLEEIGIPLAQPPWQGPRASPALRPNVAGPHHGEHTLDDWKTQISCIFTQYSHHETSTHTSPSCPKSSSTHHATCYDCKRESVAALFIPSLRYRSLFRFQILDLHTDRFISNLESLSPSPLAP